MFAKCPAGRPGTEAVFGVGRHMWRRKPDFTLKKTGGEWKLRSAAASVC